MDIEMWIIGYLAAEIINKDGDTNPAVWDSSRTEAIKRLKKLL